jgi:hypothetical protein
MSNNRLLATFVVASITVSALLLFSVAVAAEVLRAVASSLLGPMLVISLPKTDCSRNESWPIIVTGSAAPPAQTWGTPFLRIARNSHRNST